MTKLESTNTTNWNTEHLGIDAAIEEQIYLDVCPDNKNWVQNVSAWVALICEAALKSKNRSRSRGDIMSYFNPLLSSIDTEYYALIQEILDPIIEGIQERRVLYDLEEAVEATLRYDIVAVAFTKNVMLVQEEPNLSIGDLELFLTTLKQQYAYLNSVYADLLYPPIEITSRQIGDFGRDLHRLKARIATERAVAKTIANIPKQGADIKQEYGAKGAHLSQLDETLQELKKDPNMIVFRDIEVPPFMIVSIDYYVRWQKGELAAIDELVEYIHEWIVTNCEGHKCIIRSSAVNSEDGESMGPGIYDSVALPAQPSLQAIKEAIIAVFKSTDSDDAVNYRKIQNIEEEKMGLVVQLVPNDIDDATFFTYNTQAFHKLNYASYTSYRHPLFGDNETHNGSYYPSKLGMWAGFGNYGDRINPKAPTFRLPPDINKFPLANTWDAILISALCERIEGRPVQVEGILTNKKKYVVQCRVIPEHALKPKEEFMGFPDYKDENGKLIYRGGSLDIINGTKAKVLNTDFMGSSVLAAEEMDANIVFAWDTSFGAGEWEKYYKKQLLDLCIKLKQKGKQLICVIQDAPDANRNAGGGHLETLFADMEIETIFGLGQTVNKALVDGTEVTVYCDGQNALIYEVKS